MSGGQGGPPTFGPDTNKPLLVPFERLGDSCASDFHLLLPSSSPVTNLLINTVSLRSLVQFVHSHIQGLWFFGFLIWCIPTSHPSVHDVCCRCAPVVFSRQLLLESVFVYIFCTAGHDKHKNKCWFVWSRLVMFVFIVCSCYHHLCLSSMSFLPGPFNARPPDSIQSCRLVARTKPNRTLCAAMVRAITDTAIFSKGAKNLEKEIFITKNVFPPKQILLNADDIFN